MGGAGGPGGGRGTKGGNVGCKCCERRDRFGEVTLNPRP